MLRQRRWEVEGFESAYDTMRLYTFPGIWNVSPDFTCWRHHAMKACQQLMLSV